MGGFRIGKAPWGLLGAALAVFAVESVIERHELGLSRPESTVWRMSRRAAGKMAPGCDVLCFGTSMVQEGVFPRVIERESGKKTFNLAIGGGRVEFYYYHLRQALEAGARPSALLVDFHPNWITSSYRGSAGHTDVMGFRDYLDMAWTVGDADFFVRNALARMLPSEYHRHGIRNSVLAAFRGESAAMGRVNLQYIRNLNRNKGALVGQRNPRYHGEITDEYRSYFLGDGGPWQCAPDQELYIRRFLDLAANNGIRVYWLVMPLIPALQAGREANGLDAAYTRFVRSFQESSNLVVIDGRRSGYDPSVFMDACHLDPQGAYVFSRGVAEILRRFESGDADRPRWVTLPDYKEHPIDVPLEDMNQSRLALQADRAVRR